MNILARPIMMNLGKVHANNTNVQELGLFQSLYYLW